MINFFFAFLHQTIIHIYLFFIKKKRDKDSLFKRIRYAKIKLKRKFK